MGAWGDRSDGPAEPVPPRRTGVFASADREDAEEEARLEAAAALELEEGTVRGAVARRAQEPPVQQKARGLMALSKAGLFKVVGALKRIAGAFPLPRQFREYKHRRDKQSALRKEADQYAEYYEARFKGDLSRCALCMLCACSFASHAPLTSVHVLLRSAKCAVMDVHKALERKEQVVARQALEEQQKKLLPGGVSAGGFGEVYIVCGQSCPCTSMRACMHGVPCVLRGTQCTVRGAHATLCCTTGHCLKYVPRSKYHDKRKCPERKRLLEGTRLLHHALQQQLSRRNVQELRMVLGSECAPYDDFLQARDAVWAEVRVFSWGGHPGGPGASLMSLFHTGKSCVFAGHCFKRLPVCTAGMRRITNALGPARQHLRVGRLRHDTSVVVEATAHSGRATAQGAMAYARHHHGPHQRWHTIARPAAPPPSLFPWPNSHFRSHSGTVGRTVGCTVCGAG